MNVAWTKASTSSQSASTIVVVKPRGTIEKDINTAVVDHWSPGNRNMRACSDEDEDHRKIIRRMTKHTKWSVIASKEKTHYGDKTTSVLLIDDI